MGRALLRALLLAGLVAAAEPSAAFTYSVSFTNPSAHVGRMDFSQATEAWVMIRSTPDFGSDVTCDDRMYGGNYFSCGNETGSGDVLIEYGIGFNPETPDEDLWLSTNCDQSTYFYSSDPFIDICKTLFF